MHAKHMCDPLCMHASPLMLQLHSGETLHMFQSLVSASHYFRGIVFFLPRLKKHVVER